MTSFPKIIKPLKWVRPDKEIDPDKYYVCSYMRTIPVCAMVGWYKLSNARKMLDLVFGPDYERYLFFVKGTQLEDNLGNIVLYPGRIMMKGQVYPISHILFWNIEDVQASFIIANYVNEILKTNKNDKWKIEEEVVKRLEYLCYGERKGKSIPKNFKVKRSKLSEMAKTIQERKRTMYQDEGE